MQSSNGLLSLKIFLLDQNTEITEDVLNILKHSSGFEILQEHLDHNFKFSFIGVKSLVCFLFECDPGS